MEARIIDLPKILDRRGNLSFMQEHDQLPFDCRRTYWVYDVPGGELRGGHAYRHGEEVIVAMSGSFDVLVDNGKELKKYSLNRSYYGLYIPAGTWRQFTNFSTNSVAFVMSSTPYLESDYIRTKSEFRRFLSGKDIVTAATAPMQEQQPLASSAPGQLFDCTMMELERHTSPRRGDIAVVSNRVSIPFDIKRAYWLYDVPGGKHRGEHAHRALHQLIVAVSGSFSVTLSDGFTSRTFLLNRPYQALYIAPGIWRTLHDYSSGAVTLVLAGAPYDEKDYIRNFHDFTAWRKMQLRNKNL